MKFGELSLIAEKTLNLGDIETLDDLNNHVDARVNNALKSRGMSGDDNIYAVIPSSTQGNLTIFEITTDPGSDDNEELTYTAKKKGQITPDGDLISSPILRGKMVVYGVQKPDGSTAGEIRQLPGGEKLPGFNVSPARPGMRYRKVMGGVDEGEGIPFSGTPQEEPDPTLPQGPEINLQAAPAGVSPEEFAKARAERTAELELEKDKRATLEKELNDLKRDKKAGQFSAAQDNRIKHLERELRGKPAPEEGTYFGDASK
tara:strand:- start:4874 stop:5650 length:777 start_codon:yes stop_codon:yes gene_type:complete